MPVAHMVMRKGGGSGGRADHHIPIVEEAVPQQAHLVPPFIGHKPRAVRHDIGPRHLGIIAVIIGGEIRHPRFRRERPLGIDLSRRIEMDAHALDSLARRLWRQPG